MRGGKGRNFFLAKIQEFFNQKNSEKIDKKFSKIRKRTEKLQNNSELKLNIFFENSVKFRRKKQKN